MMTPLNVAQLFRELDTLKEMVGGVNDRLDTLNGRTRRLEVKVAIIWWALGAVGTLGLVIIGGKVL